MAPGGAAHHVHCRLVHAESIYLHAPMLLDLKRDSDRPSFGLKTTSSQSFSRYCDSMESFRPTEAFTRGLDCIHRAEG